MMNLNSYYANPFAPSLLGDHHGQTVVNGDAFSSSNTFAAHYNSTVATSNNATSNGRGGYDPQRQQGAPLHAGGEVKGYRSSPLQMTAPGSDHVRPGTATEVLSPGTAARHLQLQSGNANNGHLQHDPVPYDGSTLNGRSTNGGDGAGLGGPHHHQQQQQPLPPPPNPQQHQQQQQRWSQHISSSDSQSPPMPSHPHHHQQGFGPIVAGSGGGVGGGTVGPVGGGVT